MLLVFDDKEVLVQYIESLKRFKARFEVLQRLHLNPWTCAFLALGKPLGRFYAQFSFPSVFVDPVYVRLLVLVVTLNGRSRDFGVHSC